MMMVHKWLTNSQARITLVLILLCVFLGSGLFFIGNELIQNRSYYLENYETQEKMLIEMLGKQLEDIIEEEKNPAKWVEWLEHNRVATSYVWQFLYKNDKPIYVRNRGTTEEQQKKDSSLEETIKELEQKNKLVVYKQFTNRENTYAYGLIIDQNYVLLSGHVNKHSEYIVLAVSLISCIFVIITIFLVICYNRKEQQLIEMEKQLTKANVKLESLATKVNSKTVGQTAGIIVENKYATPYEGELLESFLNKSDQKELRPLGIIYIKLELADRYYTKKEIQDLIEPISRDFTSRQLLFEISKGVLVILMYRTTEKQVAELMKRIEEIWQPQLDIKELEAHMLTGFIEDNRVKAMDVFMKLQEKMKSGVSR